MLLRKISPRQQNKVGDFLLSLPWEPFIVWSTMMITVIKIDLQYIKSLPSFSYECDDSFSPNLSEKPRLRLLERRKHFRTFGMSYRKTEKSALWRISYLSFLAWTNTPRRLCRAEILRERRRNLGYKSCWKTLKRWGHVGDLGINGMTILKLNWRKLCVRLWTGLS
jgi:hypothetical protein